MILCKSFTYRIKRFANSLKSAIHIYGLFSLIILSVDAHLTLRTTITVEHFDLLHKLVGTFM